MVYVIFKLENVSVFLPIVTRHVQPEIATKIVSIEETVTKDCVSVMPTILELSVSSNKSLVLMIVQEMACVIS